MFFITSYTIYCRL